MSGPIPRIYDQIRSRLPVRFPVGGGRSGDRLGGPIRGELLGAEHLVERARALGERQEWRLPTRGFWPRRARLLGRLRETARILDEARDRVSGAADRQTDIGPAAGWLLDNMYLLREHIREAFEGLPPGFYAELPETVGGDLGGYPRVYELCIVLISHTEGRVDRANLELFTSAFQEHATLRIGELWALPALLRLALLESVRRMALRTVARLDEMDRADSWVDRIAATEEEGMEALARVLEEFTQDPPPLTPVFVSRFLHQVRIRCGAHPPLERLERWIAEEGLGAGEATGLATQQMALTQVIMANSITSLRTVGHLDWQEFVEGQSRLEAELRKDPAGIHPRMTFETRDRYRHVAERIARRTRSGEAEVAARAVELAREALEREGEDPAASPILVPEPPCPGDPRTATTHEAPGEVPLQAHVGYWLLDDGRRRLEEDFRYTPSLREALHRWVLSHPDMVLGGGLVVGTMATLALLPWLAGSGGWGIMILLVALIPANDIAVRAMNQLATTLLTPRRLPELDLTQTGGIPPSLRTVVVVPTLVESPEAVQGALEHLEIQFLANRDPALHFGILSDFVDADNEHEPDDAAILSAAATGIERLNRSYGNGDTGPFFLLHRPRLWNPAEGVWMGWERKRGKLVEFNRLIRGEEAGFHVVLGDTRHLDGVRYVITLDADTLLPRGAALLMVGALAHPLNQAVHDPEVGRVVRGYGVLQPRVGVTLPSAHRSRFAGIQSGDPGVDPYTTAVSDLYQDLYGEGSFTGKGIYDVDAFRAATEGRFPENTLLSHDLIEGNYARAGLLTGVSVYDDYPGGYLSYTRRKHRWIRGDWQLLPWLVGRKVRGAHGMERNPLSALSRWKILDNLRRSLVEIALLLFLIAGWTVLPGSPARWTVLGLLALAAPWIINLLPALLPPPSERSIRAYYAAWVRDAAAGAQQFALAVAFLPHQALISMDAVLRTLWRVVVSRRNLLEWTPSHLAEQTAAGDLWSIARAMAPASVLALGLLALLAAMATEGPGLGWITALAAGGPVLLLWFLAPAVAHQAGMRPTVPDRRLPRSRRPQAMRYAVLHWRFFEEFANEKSGWLAPDNFQENPRPVVAMRTSPTNIGLQLLSTMSARDLGILSLPDMVERLERAFDTMDSLPRYRGHFYNWYALDPPRRLDPAYVSTVDSGNLVGHLVALRQGLLVLAERPVASSLEWEATMGGVDVASQRVRGLRTGTRRERTLARELEDYLGEARGALMEAVQGNITPDTSLWITTPLEEALRTLTMARVDDEDRVELERWIRWSLARTGAATPPEPGDASPGRSNGRRGDSLLAGRITRLAQRAERYIEETDFTFLFDTERKLFSIGWNEERRTLDPSYYDLLASEARLAGFLAISRNQVPVEHWFRLGRTLTRAGGGTSSLISWSGSMFEYLMPALVMRSYRGTVLHRGEEGAVRRQISYGAERRVPWGMSESAYNLRDREFTYQYRAFGVPDLALKRGLGRDLVIAPYATILAMDVAPRPALENLTALERLNALGPYGFRDALDYTRPEGSGTHAVVATYMAHHIGMGMVALTNALTGGIWRRRFHADPTVRAAELLLQERLPRGQVFQETQRARPEDAFPEPELARPVVREFRDPDSLRPRVALLGRGSFTAMVTHAGGGYTRHGAIAVNRWRSDGTTDDAGQFCYVRDVVRDRVWSGAHHPMCAPADDYLASLATDGVTFQRRDGEIETRTEIVVVPEDLAKVRNVTVTNRGRLPARIELTSYGEIVLNQVDADRAHRAFSNLFVTTEWHAWCTGLTATRRPRSRNEPPLWGVHVLSSGGGAMGPVSWETDRARFLGRGRTPRNPMAMEAPGPLSGTVGAVLDPIFALRTELELEPGESRSLAFTTLVADSVERTFELADRYHNMHAGQRALDLAWITQQAELRELGLTPADAAAFQELAGYLLFPLHGGAGLRPTPAQRIQGAAPQPLLWAHGISGDHPILLTTIDSKDGLPTLRRLFAAHQYLRRRGMAVDLVVLNLQASSYLQELQEKILEARHTVGDVGGGSGQGAIYPLRGDQMSREERMMIEATARVRIPSDGRPLLRLLKQVEEADEAAREVLVVRSGARAGGAAGGGLVPSPVNSRAEDGPDRSGSDLPGSALLLDNGTGGFTPEGDYQVRVRGDQVPPAPWSNVVANQEAGFVVTERGGGFTWAGSSYFHRLTPWRNDPVSDEPGEVLYLRDEETGELWCPTPAPIAGDHPYTVVHSPSGSIFRHRRGGIRTRLRMGMAGEDPVKVSILELKNEGDRPRRLSLTAYVEWTLGVAREVTQNHMEVTHDPDTGAILARNPFDPDFSERVAFLALDMGSSVVDHTTDRTLFLGRNGTLAAPAALRRRGQAAARGRGGEGSREEVGSPGFVRMAPAREGEGPGFHDPCGVLQTVLELPPGAQLRVVVLLGSGRSRAEALSLLERHRRGDGGEVAVDRNREAWDRRLSVLQVQTPEPSFDVLLNRWLLHQTLSCRMWGRSALYQSGGAYGFRDQLQDAMALVYTEPALVREHLLRAASRQFVEGDVQHWWHPNTGRGVRTRFSDDLAWLPFTVDHYIRVTGDRAVLDEEVPFLEMRALGPDEHEVYDQPVVSQESGSLYEHCLRALERASTRGAHGLPLMGIGDWNDGMNRVGVGGEGESVWLAWFLLATLRSFADHARERGEGEVVERLLTAAQGYAVAANAGGWDGAWYRRAYFDDGTPLGSASNDECRIDAIAQSWSVLSGGGEPEKQRQAMEALESELVDRELRLIRLLAPPFDDGPLDPGYIKGYLPGVRENGAQYTHAALWAVQAVAEQGRGDRALELYQMINPLEHAATPEGVERYRVEPYVVAADVYTSPGQPGRGGWTWYTGSSSWMYRVGLESILGFRLRGNLLFLEPVVPASWPFFHIDYRYGSTLYRIRVEEPGRIREEGAEVTVEPEVGAGGGVSPVVGGGSHWEGGPASEGLADGERVAGGERVARRKPDSGMDATPDPRTGSGVHTSTPPGGQRMPEGAIVLVDDGVTRDVLVRPRG
jgi:cyclic beta-1,2-glucan synthetase